jgi:hypothetical protein
MFLPCQKQDYDSAFQEGCDDAATGDENNQYMKYSARWFGYRDGCRAIEGEHSKVGTSILNEMLHNDLGG